MSFTLAPKYRIREQKCFINERGYFGIEVREAWRRCRHVHIYMERWVKFSRNLWWGLYWRLDAIDQSCLQSTTALRMNN